MGYLTSSITTLRCQACCHFLTILPTSPAIVTFCRYLSYRRESSSDYSDYSDDEFSSDEEEQGDPKGGGGGGGGGDAGEGGDLSVHDPAIASQTVGSRCVCGKTARRTFV